MLTSTDPIADMLTRIRNAIAVNRNSVDVPYSKLKNVVAQQLQAAGFLKGVKVLEDGKFKVIQIEIADQNQPVKITHIERVSKPGRRMYAKVGDIPRVKNGRGVVLVSTSKGVMTGNEAQKKKLGGELICKVY